MQDKIREFPFSPHLMAGREKKKEPDASGSSQVLSEDDHRNSFFNYTTQGEIMQEALRIAD